MSEPDLVSRCSALPWPLLFNLVERMGLDPDQFREMDAPAAHALVLRRMMAAFGLREEHLKMALDSIRPKPGVVPPPVPATTHDVMLSYNREDVAFVRMLRDFLQSPAVGLRVWNDEKDLTAADDWRDAIFYDEVPKKVGGMLGCFGAHGCGKTHQTELDLLPSRFKIAGRKVMTILMPGGDKTMIPGHLTRTVPIDVTSGNLDNQLAVAVKRGLGLHA